MEVDLLGIISNAWFIGIASSIISSLIVYWVTNRIFSKKQNREYFQKVNAANNEILYIIRPLIVDKMVPDSEIVSSLINSTAKKYQINLKDIYTRELLVNDIIKEILENPFLSSSAKLEYCTSVQIIANPNDNELVNKAMEDTLSSEKSSFENVRVMSLFMSVFTALASLLLFAFVFEKKQIFDVKMIIPLVSLATFVFVVASILLTMNEKFFKILNSILFDDKTNIDDNKNSN